uniref:Uncharacterized protein n=1 Tax=Cacopsylla melanoneura TaxID=428564 RepID=A0A8D8RE79_9HEMI
MTKTPCPVAGHLKPMRVPLALRPARLSLRNQPPALTMKVLMTLNNLDPHKQREYESATLRVIAVLMCSTLNLSLTQRKKLPLTSTLQIMLSFGSLELVDFLQDLIIIYY